MDFFRSPKKVILPKRRTRSFPKDKNPTPSWAYHWDTLLQWNKNRDGVTTNLAVVERSLDGFVSVLSLLVTGFNREYNSRSKNIISLPFVYLSPDRLNSDFEKKRIVTHLTDIANYATTKYGSTHIWIQDIGDTFIPDEYSTYLSCLEKKKIVGTPLYDKAERIEPIILKSFVDFLPASQNVNYRELEHIVDSFKRD
ncbi:hypothetical protein HOA92_05585 [archaeon]|jgi:hypothetical protein|nr:hypothetical protein [archaeon]MBT6762485.1 hypothetical protein [archaeon]